LKDWRLHIFSDFDGTIALTDVCIDIIDKFSNREPYLTLLATGKLTLKDFWHQVLKTFPSNLSIEEMIQFVKQSVQVDPYFVEFVNFCKENQIPFKILSDGFDFYIQATLDKFGITDIPYFGNQLVKTNDHYEPVFVYANESCQCENVGSCKRNIALSRLADDEVLVYIGDGYSDFCMVEYSDIIFAKSILSRYCNEKRIPHYNFKTFLEIINVLKKLLREKKIKPRRQAQLNRKKAFEIE
jgi:2,3-diketo-5-methylthio-1-phosphopentane phosphatase